MRCKNSSIKPRKSATAAPKPARKSRTKTRKPKYLSLKLQLSSQQQKPFKMSHKQQLHLFPLHPENLVQDKQDTMKDDQIADHVAFLFETANDTSTSLHGILDSTTTTTTTTGASEDVYRGHESDEERSLLVKTAMKCKERDASEERWVSYWEVVEKKEQEEVSSCCCDGGGEALKKMMQAQAGDDDKKGLLVGLKLDYQHILNAWSDKGSLYISQDSPQIVPDLHRPPHGLIDGWENIWRVPEVEKKGQREASVLRYKEKRQSRLFAKRIRYQVRKLNAEKRPRLKGRFVKRNGEE